MDNNYIYHFSYGSCLSELRLKIHCPSAERIFIGNLNNYRFGFGNYFSKEWNGNVATIIPNKNSCVWGSVWKIPKHEIYKLDIQEEIHLGIYRVEYIKISCFNFSNFYIKEMLCYTYILNNNDIGYLPSESYLHTIIVGALQAQLPNDYINFLISFKHNGRKAKFIKSFY